MSTIQFKHKTISLLSACVLFMACGPSTTRVKSDIIISNSDTLLDDSSSLANLFQDVLKTIPDSVKPVWGYRFVLAGDFDGDGQQEKLIEHFVSKRTHKETNKFYDNLSEYEQLVALTEQCDPYSFMVSDNAKIDTLRISSGGQLLGLAYLKNEGDLNGDGTDEVSYVVNWADWSSTNTWNVVTYKNNKWTELYSFPIWEWQLPDLPETYNNYGPFGRENIIVNTANDTINARLEKELLAFEGLLKKIKTNKIQIIFRNEESMEDTKIVDLQRVKP